MIDTTGLIVPMTRRLFNTVLAESNTPYSRVWKRVITRFGSFRVTIHVEERTMTLELSPMMYLVGHNVFGTNHLDRLVLGILKLIYGHFHLPFTERDEAFYADKGVGLSRVDLTASFLVGSQSKVINTLGLLCDHLLDHGHYIVSHEGPQGVETVYVGKSSSRSAVKFYNKYLEILAKNKSTVLLPYFMELLSFTAKIVRFEVTLRAPDLKYYGLENSKAWSVSKVREILEVKLHELGLSSQLLAELPDDAVASLKADRRSKYSLWLAGNDLRQHYAPWTFARDRNIFLEKGIDIARSHAYAQDAVILSERLSAAQMKMTWPEQFVALGAVYR